MAIAETMATSFLADTELQSKTKLGAQLLEPDEKTEEWYGVGVRNQMSFLAAPNSVDLNLDYIEFWMMILNSGRTLTPDRPTVFRLRLGAAVLASTLQSSLHQLFVPILGAAV